MNRRDFLKQVALWSAGAAVMKPAFNITPDLFAAEAVPPVLVTGKGKDYAALVENVLKPLGGMAAFVKKGDKVVIKPNIGWDRTPEQGANTHPEVVKSLAMMAIGAGAGQVMVFDRTCNEERRCYDSSGIKSAVESIQNSRVKISYIDERKFVPVKIKNGKSLQEWEFYKAALEADCYINVPVAKHHGLSGLTLGLKNIMGVIGGRRGKIHGNIGQNLADLNTVLRPQLTVIDATRILIKNGPRGGSVDDVKELNTLIASRDIVAADAYATTLFGKKPEAISSTVAGYQMGLGEMRLEKIRIMTV